MSNQGVRKILQPLLYLGVALLAHGLLFLIPYGTGTRQESGTTRGIRVRAIGESRPAPTVAPAPAIPVSAATPPPVPPPPAEKNYSSLGGGTPGPGKETTGTPGGGGGQKGEGGTSDRSVEGGSGPPAESVYGTYLARLRSERVQGWAKETAGQQRQGWRGSGKAGDGWGSGSGGTTGGGKGSSPGAGGTGTGYLDPRVKMVVTHYPLDANGNALERKASNLENSFRQIPYPEKKFRKAEYTSGWWNIYIRLRTDKSGRVVQSDVLRPTTDGPLEKVFIEQVRSEIAKWSFARMEAEITVDVRFYVE